MRFLCLHGHGTNSRILEAQLEPLRSRLPSNWEFEFLDGEMEVESALGVDSIFPGPYLCFHGEPIPKDVRSAYELIMEVVREEGPFDGVIAFSQGAAVAATIIATEAETNPGQGPFNVAIFLNATMPFDLSAGQLHLACDDDGNLTAAHQNYSGAVVDGKGDSDSTDWLADCRAAGVIQEFATRRSRVVQRDADAVVPTSIDVLLRYHPSTHGVRIDIPTVHVVGRKDEWADQGLDLAAMCEPKLVQMVMNDGGHQLPRDAGILAEVAEAIQWAVERSIFRN